MKIKIKETSRGKIAIAGARLSYPSLHEPKIWKDKDGNIISDDRYEATFLIPKESTKTIKFLKDCMREEWKANAIKGKPEKWGLKEPIDPDSDDYDDDDEVDETKTDYYSLIAKTKFPPDVRDTDKTRIRDDDIQQTFYAGCYVEAIVDCFAYDNVNKGISWNLYGVRFLKDGEELGSGSSMSEDEWDELDEFEDEPAPKAKKIKSRKEKVKESLKKGKKTDVRKTKDKQDKEYEDDDEDDLPF